MASLFNLGPSTGQITPTWIQSYMDWSVGTLKATMEGSTRAPIDDFYDIRDRAKAEALVRDLLIAKAQAQFGTGRDITHHMDVILFDRSFGVRYQLVEAGECHPAYRGLTDIRFRPEGDMI